MYDIQPGNRVGLFLQPRSLHGPVTLKTVLSVCEGQLNVTIR